jgi:lysophospholipid acyltransferase (LPLAT)-like uncharacterized protein
MPQTQLMSKPPKPQSSGIVVPHKPKWYQRLAARLIYAATRAVSATIRYEWRDTTGLIKDKGREPAIFCVWHNRLALCLEVYRDYVCGVGRDARMAAMVSASKDGGLLARVLELNGVQPARGSTSRRGRQALLELITWSERGYDLAITPDGPRGPCYVVQDGVISLAQLSGQPIVPVSYHLNWKIRVKSWDRFQIPLPFTRCQVSLAEPIRVPRDASEEEREKLRQELEQRLRSITLDS